MYQLLTIGLILALYFGVTFLWKMLDNSKGYLSANYVLCVKEGEQWKGLKESREILKRKYRVSFDNQMVVVDSGIKFTDCTVFDVKNWSCKTASQGKIEFKDAKATMVSCDKTQTRCALPLKYSGRFASKFKVLSEGGIDFYCRKNAKRMEEITSSMWPW